MKYSFKRSDPLTLGIELELQIIHPVTRDLISAADQLLAAAASHPSADRIKPEITKAMIELNSEVHGSAPELLTEVKALRDVLINAADLVNVGIAGGGCHPFMSWKDRDIFDAPRFHYLSETYGYLAQQFTVFGQHIHIGVEKGDEAIAISQKLAPYVPHFVALAASSPFFEGVDTQFMCGRLNALNAFPLSGSLPPDIHGWKDFEQHLEQLQQSGLIESIKDLYWDIRPKPEFGTVELRVCDTPLSVDRACQLAAFAQALVAWLHSQPIPGQLAPLCYRTNRFQAARYGLGGYYVDERQGKERLYEHLLRTLDQVQPFAESLGSAAMLEPLYEQARRRQGDADWMRERHAELNSLPEVVTACRQVFRGESPSTEVEPLAPSTPRRIRALSEPIIGRSAALSIPPEYKNVLH